MGIKKVSSSILSEKTLVTVPAPSAPSPGTNLTWDYSDPTHAKEYERIWLTNGQPVTRYHGGGPQIFLGKANGTGTITYSATNLASGLSINSANSLLSGSANPVGYSEVVVTATNGTDTITKTVYVVQRSQQQYTSPGTYTFTVPNYVDVVSAVLIGGGGGAGHGAPSTSPGGTGSGGGGGLRWISNLSVTGGENLTVVVGAGGTTTYNPPTVPSPTAASRNTRTGNPGGTSSIARGPTVIIQATGGGGSINPAPPSGPSGGPAGSAGGGTAIGPNPFGLIGGGNGAAGMSSSGGSTGGGAGGYNGNGSNGPYPGPQNNSLTAEIRTEGGGGTGAPLITPTSGYGGGGTNIFGQGQGGLRASILPPAGVSAGRITSTGSGAPQPPVMPGGLGLGGLYGGGGSASAPIPLGASYNGGGGTGAVRIIWGNDRSYPGSYPSTLMNNL